MKALRDWNDIERAARSVAAHFEADTVVVVGSQAILIDWPDAPEQLRLTPEIDIYPGNNRDWEAANPGTEASEEINGLFGAMSRFEEQFGFYLDGVDEHTAKMPADWKSRARTATIDVYGRHVTIVCPAIEDVAVSKLLRFAEKDRNFIVDCVNADRLDVDTVLVRLKQIVMGSAQRKEIEEFLAALKKSS